MFESLEALVGHLRHAGAERIYAKILAPNDNSKNQIYLGGDFSALNIIPHGEILTDDSETAGSVRDRAKAGVKLFWVDVSGRQLAPNTQLILYPKYPEIRMSGFLSGCRSAPSETMRMRDAGRVLFLGITRDGSVLGYAAPAESTPAAAVVARQDWEKIGVFLQIPMTPEAGSSRTRLLETLLAIYRRDWLPSSKLGNDGKAHSYQARNGGGYTLEAMLGISPNSYSEPDFLGWEIKQYGVSDFDAFKAKSPVTLLTPEPTGGYYRENGAEAFVRQFGYPDKTGKVDRLNFGGIYACGKTWHPDTGLRMDMAGFDKSKGTISDFSGGLVLLDRKDAIAALWKFPDIISHWNRKHAQAAYIPSLFRTPPPEYRFGPRIQLCEETDLILFLGAIASGKIYYDPGIKIEAASASNPIIKKRSQFRIRHEELGRLYHRSETIDLRNT